MFASGVPSRLANPSSTVAPRFVRAMHSWPSKPRPQSFRSTRCCARYSDTRSIPVQRRPGSLRGTVVLSRPCRGSRRRTTRGLSAAMSVRTRAREVRPEGKLGVDRSAHRLVRTRGRRRRVAALKTVTRIASTDRAARAARHRAVRRYSQCHRDIYIYTCI